MYIIQTHNTEPNPLNQKGLYLRGLFCVLKWSEAGGPPSLQLDIGTPRGKNGVAHGLL